MLRFSPARRLEGCWTAISVFLGKNFSYSDRCGNVVADTEFINGVKMANFTLDKFTVVQSEFARHFLQFFKMKKVYKKRLFSRINPSLLLKIILYNT